MAGQVCVDASLALMLLLPHDLTPQVDVLWRAWVRRRVERVTAPTRTSGPRRGSQRLWPS